MPNIKQAKYNGQEVVIPLNMNEVAKTLHISRKSLRQLEREKVLTPTTIFFKGPKRGWHRRHYLPVDIERVRLITRLMKFGLTLRVIKKILPSAKASFRGADLDKEFMRIFAAEFRKTKT